MEDKYQFMRFVSYSKLQNWSVQYTRTGGFGYSNKYPLGCIGSFLHRSGAVVEIADDIEYSQVTVRTNNGGVCLRGTKLGKEIGTKRQIKVSKGQYIVSKIDARNGAFGIIPDDLDGAIVTNDFPVFDVDNSVILTEFLLLVTTTKQFIAFAQSCSSGTTNRRRIDIDKFLDQKIPLPSLSEQKRLLCVYNEYIKKINNSLTIIEGLKGEIDNYILQQLSVEVKTSSLHILPNHRYLKIAHSSSLTRWDCYHIKEEPRSKIYDNKVLSQLIVEEPMYGAAFKAGDTFTGVRYIRITDINEDGTLNNNAISAQGYDEHYLLKNNDFLIARSGNTVGKTFLYEEKYGKAIFAGYLIKFTLDEKTLNPKYLLFYTKSTLFKQWIESNKRVSAQPNINSQQYLSSPVILPPKTIQDEMVTYIQGLYDCIQEQKNDISKYKVMALNDFEKTLFSLNE